MVELHLTGSQFLSTAVDICCRRLDQTARSDKMIIYLMRVDSVRIFAERLGSKGVDTLQYHGNLSDEDKGLAMSR